MELGKFKNIFKIKEKLFSTVDDLYQDMRNKKNDYYNHKVDKYVISYQILDKGHIEVKSNIGRTRVVKNNKANIKKLNQVIVKNKVTIERRIDEYENDTSIRLFILCISIMMLLLSFGCVLSTFCMGNIVLLICSLLLFSTISTLSYIQGTHLYLLVQEIRSLKNLTGYKKEKELSLPKFKLFNK